MIRGIRWACLVYFIVYFAILGAKAVIIWLQQLLGGIF